MSGLISQWRERIGALVNPPEADPASFNVGEAPSDTAPVLRIGKFLLIFGLGGFLLWAALAPLDEGVPTAGTVVVESRRKVVSHLTGGTVAAISVNEDALVDAGAPLVVLDDTSIRAEYDSALQIQFSALAMVARLRAEKLGGNLLHFPEELTRTPVHPLAAQHMATQRALFVSRRAALASDLAVLAHAASSAELAARGLDDQKALLEQELKGLRDLAAEGYVPRNQLLLREREFSDISGRSLQATRASVDARLRMEQRRQEYEREVGTELGRLEPEAQNSMERVKVLRQALERTVIRAPVRGYVTALAVHTQGGIVAPGAKLLEIVPADELLEIEARVPPQLIDKVHAGLKAQIGLHAFPESPGLSVEGTVVSVSADLLYGATTDVPPYFLAMVRVTPAGLKELGRRELHAGMPADVVILTGERTMLGYLLRPLLQRLDLSFKEP